MVLTKMPMIPFGESLPPTMLKPRLFLPAPFSNTIVWKVPLPMAAFTTDAAAGFVLVAFLFLCFLQMSCPFRTVNIEAHRVMAYNLCY